MVTAEHGSGKAHKEMLPRCEHGMYSPSGDGQPSEFCSGCKVSNVGIDVMTIPTHYEDQIINGGWVNTEDGEEFYPPLSDKQVVNEIQDLALSLCPRCFEPMQVEDEYNLECGNCGFNDL